MRTFGSRVLVVVEKAVKTCNITKLNAYHKINYFYYEFKIMFGKKYCVLEVRHIKMT